VPLIDLASVCKYWALWSNLAVCHLFATFGVSQAKSDRPIKALENTSPLAFTQIEEEPRKAQMFMALLNGGRSASHVLFKAKSAYCHPIELFGVDDDPLGFGLPFLRSPNE
jgi:hypothetical protein